MYFSFTSEIYLIFLFLIPVFIFIHFYSLKSSRKKALKFSNFDAIGRVEGIDFFSKNIVLLFLSILIIFCLTLSLSGFTLHKLADTSSFSFILAIDSSSSMQATDISPNRFDSAKEHALKFVDNLPSETFIGVISFSGNVYIQGELEKDKLQIKKNIKDIYYGKAGGTDIYEAILTSTNLLLNQNAGAIVLISDGQTNVGDLEAAIDYANKNDILVHTVGIGTIEGGDTYYGLSQIDVDSLKSISYNTGGRFFNVENSEDFEESFREISDITQRKVSIDLSNYFLIAGILLFFVYYSLSNLRYRILP